MSGIITSNPGKPKASRPTTEIKHLLQEVGHPGDVLGALQELKRLQVALTPQSLKQLESAHIVGGFTIG